MPVTTLAVLSWLAYCFCGYAACLVAWTLWKGRRPRHAERWMKWIDERGQKWQKWQEHWQERWRRTKASSKDRIDGWTSSWLVVSIFALGCCSLLAFAAYHQRPNLVTEHNVVIYRQLSDGDWQMSSDEESDLVFRPCPDDGAGGVDVNGLFASAVGYVADYAKWEERGTCKSILRSDLGFWFRDKHNHYEYRKAN